MGLAQCSFPGDGSKLASVAHKRLSDPLGRMNHLIREAPLVAQPSVINLYVVPCQCPNDLAVVAHGELDVALAWAERADRSRVLDVPRASAEAVRRRGQRADGAELDDVAAERRDVRPPVVRADVRVVGALEEDQLVVLGDLLGEAHAAVAEDAAFAVDRHERRELERLDEMSLRLDVARAARPPPERDVLERALAALVADRAVERMVDEQELDDRVLRVLDPLR